jgi:hypothetical protein
LFRYSQHAKKRLAERSITETDVERTLRNPAEVIRVRYNRHAACNPLSNRKFLVVIYEQEEEDFIVVTAFITNRKGAKRYGFTRV